MKPGIVYLVGAGPGDVELLTLKAVRAIKEADVLLVDALVNPEALQFARPSARIISVGKRGGYKSTSQSCIQDQMIELALTGLCVTRLKGGDPFMFGRGGEEIQSLTAAGIQVIVIPGVTSGMAAPAMLGIPLTHRNHSYSVTFVAGHRRREGQADWHTLAKSASTLVIYMGMSNLPHIVAELLNAGLPASTPAAAIQHGTLPIQKQVASSLEHLPKTVEHAGLESPGIIVIGSVVSLSPYFKNSACISGTDISAIDNCV